MRNSVRLVSHLTLRGEGPEKTILKKAPGVRSKLSVDADYGEFIATVEDASGFAPGMGVTIVDKEQRSGWTPSIRTVVSVQGNTLRFDRFLHMDYSVANDGEVFNTFPLISRATKLRTSASKTSRRMAAATRVKPWTVARPPPSTSSTPSG
ncbi:MAG: hypothetical protein DMG26_05880 [Acidobacteria bacterium]|nr:MAG: hypothetical protein DMG26_05880 [Acidobacteriota bacterium]